MMTGTHFAAVGTLCLVAVALTGFIYMRHPFACNTKERANKATPQYTKIQTAFHGKTRAKK
jgi:hypothetical protein